MWIHLPRSPMIVPWRNRNKKLRRILDPLFFSLQPHVGLKSGIFLRMWLNELFCFFARTFYNPRLKNSLVSFFEIVLFNSTFWAFKETVLRMGHFRMHAKIMSSINLHQYVASGLTEKLTEQFFEIL